MHTLALILALDALIALAVTVVLRAALRTLDVPNHGSFGENYVYTLAWAGIYSGGLYVQYKYD